MNDDVHKNCVYCLENHELSKEQILLRGKSLYLCAPRGQLVEGYLAVAPYRCIGCLSQMPSDYFPELTRIRQIISTFYDVAYGIGEGTYYEQGRAGGGALVDKTGGFPHHAHLCCLPLRLNLHALLVQRYVKKCIASAYDLPAHTEDSPYIYVESVDVEGCYKKCVYIAQSEDRRAELEGKRLKPEIAVLAGVPERGDWRAYPGDYELQRVIERFAQFRRDGYCGLNAACAGSSA